MDFFRQIYEQFASIWKSLDLQRRIFIGLGVAIALVALFSLTLWQTATEYSVLFSNLQQSDAGEIVEKLKGMDVSYKISDNGDTIFVPAGAVPETRLALAQEGLPRGGGVGYEIFDRTRLGVTSFEQKVNLKRAIEGELARTINQLAEVQWSRVQTAMVEERLFSEQQQEPTASVFLNVIPGRSLSRRQIRAIQHLVANSIEGLKPGNITILDQYATPLAVPSEPYAGTTELSSSQFELRSRVERHFRDKLQSMFDRVLGAGKSVVSVSVDLDFDSIERTEEKYDPESAVVRSEERQKETSTSPSVQPEGIAGISANLPSVRPLAAATIAGPRKDSAQTTTNYEISKTVEHIIKSPSSIRGVSISVVVDGTYKQVAASDGTVTKEYMPRSEDEIEKYKRMVLAAVGNPATSSAEVINVPLDTSAAEMALAAAVTAEKAGEQRDLYLLFGKGAMTIAVLAFIFLLLRYVLKNVLPVLSVSHEGEVGARIDMVAEEKASDLREVKEMADERPDDVASLIKVWLKEEQ